MRTLGCAFYPLSTVHCVGQVESGRDIRIAIRRPFILNLDLVFCLKHDLPFSPYNRDTFYIVKSEIGYNDYPFSEEAIKAGLVSISS